jgi:hypothetical protein
MAAYIWRNWAAAGVDSELKTEFMMIPSNKNIETDYIVFKKS